MIRAKPYNLRAILVGRLRGIRRAVFIDDDTEGTLDVPCIAWLAYRDGSVVLFDSGPGDAAAVHSPPLERGSVPDLATSVAALGVDPGSVGVVVLSHLHWDHIGGMSSFPDATFVVQRAELDAAQDPPTGQEVTYDDAALGLEPHWTTWLDQMEVIDGDNKLFDGLEVMHLPGHTPGSQGLLVPTSAGCVLLAGDAIPLYANIRGAALAPGQLVADSSGALASMERALSLTNLIAPGHDEECLTQGWLG